MDYKSMTFIHYGSEKYDPEKFKKAVNCKVPHTKPEFHTGLWASPVNSNWGWIDWCESEDFGNSREDDFFTFKLTPHCRLYVIDSLHDLSGLPVINNSYMLNDKELDFEKISTRYDAILLTEKGQRETSFFASLKFIWMGLRKYINLKSQYDKRTNTPLVSHNHMWNYVS